DTSSVKVVDAMAILCQDAVKADVEQGIMLATILADAQNYTRDLINTPARDMTPTVLAAEAQKLAKKHNLGVKVFGKADLKRMKMEALLGVSAGSDQEPKLIVLEYNKSAKESIAFVGKGITFDSGGLSIKPWNYMLEMKDDMSGGATVLGAMSAIAQLKPKVRIIGVIAASENMLGGSAQKPGDIVKAYNGKTIEVLNTDAEGRLVLADALSYVSKDIKPKAIVDLATLTGACIVALGMTVSGLMTNNRELADKVRTAGGTVAERVWELPLVQEYHDLMKGDIGDLRNIQKGKGYEAGTSSAGAFLSNFVEKTPWVHLDIAGTAFQSEEREYWPRFATGWGVRLLAQLARDWTPMKDTSVKNSI
ncbi:MAG: leucyl aminopeptidase, partial [Nanoarchaeota archaeon]